eukprot:scaffold7375_cov268-Pinguiococcus_pyrenoidosus.AAC.56
MRQIEDGQALQLLACVSADVLKEAIHLDESALHARYGHGDAAVYKRVSVVALGQGLADVSLRHGSQKCDVLLSLVIKSRGPLLQRFDVLCNPCQDAKLVSLHVDAAPVQQAVELLDLLADPKAPPLLTEVPLVPPAIRGAVLGASVVFVC